MKRYLIIDTDCGTDDGMAVAMAGRAMVEGLVEILCIGVCSGNSTVDHSCENVVRILESIDLLGKIPIHKGCESSMVQSNKYFSPYNGHDGFGDCCPPFPSWEDQISSVHAAISLVELANKYKGEIELVALGPLTNIGVAIQLDRSLTKKLKAIHVMGGNVAGKGNTVSGVTEEHSRYFSAEFNFHYDPEAAHVVFSNCYCPLYMYPWELGLDTKFTWGWRLNVLGKINTRVAELLNLAETTIQNKLGEKEDDYYITCDQLAIAGCLFPRVVEDKETRHVVIELCGTTTRGQSVVDYDGRLNKEQNVIIVKKVNHEKYSSILLWSLGHDVDSKFNQS